MSGLAPLRLVEEELESPFRTHRRRRWADMCSSRGRIPDTGEIVVVDGHEVEILQVDEARILELRFL